MSVKHLVFSVLLIFATHHTLASDASAEEEKVAIECMKETGVEMEEVRAFRTDKVSEKMMCFMKCRYEKMGFFDENGTLIKEVIQDSYDEFNFNEQQKQQTDECMDKMKPVKECKDLGDFFSCVPVIDFSLM